MSSVQWASGALLVIAVTVGIAIAVTRNRRATEAPGAPTASSRKDAEDDRATRMQVDFVLSEKGRSVKRISVRLWRL